LHISNLAIYGATDRGMNIGSLGSVTRNCTFNDIKIFNPNVGLLSAGSEPSAIYLRAATGMDFDGVSVKGVNHTYVVQESAGATDNSFLNIKADAGTLGRFLPNGVTSKYSEAARSEMRGGYSMVESVGLADGASHTFTARGANARALYRVMTDYTEQTAASFTASSGTVTIAYTGTLVAVAATDPGTAGKLSVFLTGNSVTVTNRLGSFRNVLLESLATS
jgi:hypothetical protein